METREKRGIIIAATVRLTEQHCVWVVPSATSGDKRYVVDPRKGSCTCPDHAETGFKCKHQFAVEFTLRRECKPDGTVVEQKTVTWTEEKTYTQDWPNYDRAQMNEKSRLQVLLADLAKTVPDPERVPPEKGIIPPIELTHNTLHPPAIRRNRESYRKAGLIQRSEDMPVDPGKKCLRHFRISQ